MRDPRLPAEQFKLDEVLSRESLFGPESFASLDHTYREEETVRFSAHERLIVTLRPVPGDLSRFDRVVVCALDRTRESLLAGMRLIHGPDDSASGSPVVSFSGGREEVPPGRWVELNFPRECFGTYGAPLGWSDVRAIELSFSREKGAPEGSTIEVSVDRAYGESRQLPEGPRLTPEGLTNMLDPDIADDPYSAVTATQRSGRPTLWDPYCAGNLSLSIPPPHPYPRESGEEVLRGRIMGQALPEPIPWDADPLSSQEWTHFLNRQHFLREVVRALADSGDERYAQALDRIILSWIKANPVPVSSNGGAGPAWETLSVAWRLREWLWVIGIAWSSGFFRETTKMIMICSVWEHARSLMAHQGHPNNWIVVESAALALAGICFPHFRESDEWRETGLERLQREFNRQFFNDGAHFELSPFYHAICLAAFMEVREAASVRGIPLPGEFDAPLERCADYLAALYRPDFSWPSLNDSGSADMDFTAVVRTSGEVFRRPDFTWIGTRGRDGFVPTEKSTFFSDAGIAIMRSHHGEDADMLVFRAGPPGFTHVHEDVLSLDVTALGVPRLADPGITTYAPGALTDYYRSAQAHTTILIDGKGPTRSGLAPSAMIVPASSRFSFVRSGDLEIASGLCRGPWPHTDEKLVILRTVVFVKGEYWIVRDLIDGQEAHKVTPCWQFLPGLVELDLRTLAAACVDARGPRFDLIPLFGTGSCFVEQFTGALHPPRGWFSIGGADLPGTTVQYHVTGPFPMTLVWILLPFRGRRSSGIKALRTDDPTEKVSLDIRFPGPNTDLISLEKPTEQDLLIGGDRLHGTLNFRRIHKNGRGEGSKTNQ